MRVFDFRLVNGWSKRPDDFLPLMSITMEGMEPDQPQTEKYRLVAEFGLEFHCNPAQLDWALDTARKALAARLYGDINSMVTELMSRILGGDRQSSLTICHRILEYCKAP